ncbi:MAG: hypothetical protein DLM72_03430 [Candidatus Nitrosopolaris wilkensis]|nr:MAG: hypothetical protein DLM72_03430 [Candidatus Nitrosopolaris wilkensis]
MERSALLLEAISAFTFLTLCRTALLPETITITAIEENNTIRASSDRALLTIEDTSLSNESINNAATRTKIGTEGNFKPRLGPDNSFVVLVDVDPPPLRYFIVQMLLLKA